MVEGGDKRGKQYMGEVRMIDLAQGDMVEWNNGDSRGVGRVCGIAQTAFPVIGRSIILRIESSDVDTTVYPFSHCAQFEVHLTKI